jgi:predicted O-methyltransferase YrrM
MVPHLATLTRLAGDARSVVECGVRGGVSTWAILDGLPPGGRLLSIDVDPKVPELVPSRVRDDPRWTLLTADDRKVDWPAADLVFIDTSHRHAHTMEELARAVETGARTIVLHDYALAPVARAAHAFIRSHGWSLTVEPSQWDLAVLRCP